MEQRPVEESDYNEAWAKYRQRELAEHGDLAARLNIMEMDDFPP
jgi:hypothetical protein